MVANAAALLLATGAASANPALTIYNQNFAVVRDAIHLDLKPGVNDISYTEATMHLEPDSVVLRDPTGRKQLANPGTELPGRSDFARAAAQLLRGKNDRF